MRVVKGLLPDTGDVLSELDVRGTEKEVRQALIRLLIWLFATVYFGLGFYLDYYTYGFDTYLAFSAVFLAVALAIAFEVRRRPGVPARVFATLLVDLLANTLAMVLTGGSKSPFFLVYLWIVVGYVARYGRPVLLPVTVISILSYTLVVTVTGGWRMLDLEVLMHFLALALVPLYLHSLLKTIRRAQHAADAANQAKGQFLARMSHEIRTPLTGLVGSVDLLRTTDLDEEQSGYVNGLKASASALHALLDDILDFSRIEAGRLELEEREMDLHRVIADVAGVLAPVAVAKGVELVTHLQPELPQRLIGDPHRLRQVLLNLVGNAIKFTERGEVVVRAMVLPSGVPGPVRVRIEVSDTGIGIAPERLPGIFDRFTQGNSATPRRYGGSGLGTAIARELIRLMGGEIGVASELGSGSIFWIEVPWRRAPQACAREPAGELTGRRVLVLEDNAASRAVMFDYCRALGMIPHCVGTEDEVEPLLVRAEADRRPFEVVLLGDTAGGEGRHPLVRRLQGLGPGRPRLCYLTFLGQRRHVEEATRAGLDGFLTKPVSLDLLRDCLLGVLAGDGRRRTMVTSETLGAADHDPVRVLVADDDPINARVVSTFLSKAGYQVDVAQDGRRALHLATTVAYCLALVDLHMPELDGPQFAATWRDLEAGGERRLPIVALTAGASSEDREQCLSAGMDDFLTKPVSPERLLEVVARFVSEGEADLDVMLSPPRQPPAISGGRPRTNSN
jgi:two-component system sensor histidine kinase RpfC